MLRKLKKYSTTSIAILTIVLLLQGCSDSDRDTKKILSAQAKHQTTVNLLIKEYRANEVRADAKYADEIVEISGYVGEIGKDVFDGIYIMLNGGGFFDTDDVHCTFSKSEEKSVANLSTNDKVTVKGRVDGLLLGIVTLSNCVISNPVS